MKSPILISGQGLLWEDGLAKAGFVDGEGKVVRPFSIR